MNNKYYILSAKNFICFNNLKIYDIETIQIKSATKVLLNPFQLEHQLNH